MSKLAGILTDLVERAERNRPPCSASTVLGNGLHITAHPTVSGQAALSLSRSATTPPSQTEAETCANHLGWTSRKIMSGKTRQDWPCLLIWRVPS